MGDRNLILPGNPRYQPKQLVEIFGYDNLYAGVAEVEIATLETLGEIGVIPAEDMAGLTAEVMVRLKEIPTTVVDQVERSITKHDIRAWVRIAQDIVGPKLGRWIHVPLTSYDAIDTGRAVQFSQAYQGVLKSAIAELVENIAGLAGGLATELQIGRTHGQHALPITVGFWLATILHRITFNWQQFDRHALMIVGKISGAVGAYNAQVGLGFDDLCRQKTGQTFEARVLKRLGLEPAPISTQILPPEPLTYFLFSATMLSASLAQLGRDGRNLMRSEIGEVVEAFEDGQVGSSTMAHKRNPINFESTEGMWIRTKNEFGKVTDTLLSDHQRDLVGSSVMRDFPIILVNLMVQLNTLLRKDDKKVPFVRKVSVNREACRRNFEQSAHLILAEPLYIALQMAGYQGDAHELVNRRLMPLATAKKISLTDAAEEIAREDPELDSALVRMPDDILKLLYDPGRYIGKAAEKTREIVLLAREASRRILDPEAAEG